MRDSDGARLEALRRLWTCAARGMELRTETAAVLEIEGTWD